MEMHEQDHSFSRRKTAKLTTILAMLLLGLFAINSPATYAATGSNSNAVAQLQQANSSAIADVAAEANPATVTVYNLQAQQNQFGDQSSTDVVPVGSGSGYIIDEAGHVVTNNHVVEGGAAFEVRFEDGTMVDATLVGTDAFQDVAVLQLDLSDGETVPGTVQFGDSSDLRAGDEVSAIGSPFGEYANTVTAGIVNAVDRSLDTGEGYLMPNLIQHDADIYPGNSGGPLLNDAGEVVGMNVAKAVAPTMGNTTEQTNIGFAIEGNEVKEIVDELIADGSVARSYLGIRTELTVNGQSIVSVEPDGPAAEAGLQAGDLVVEVDGDAITEENPFINELIFDHKPGEVVDLSIERNGESMTIEVTLGERPAETQ